MDVLIAGGGIAGLEALLGLREVAGERVRLTLVAPDPDFTYRPMAVAEPFAVGQAKRVPLTEIAAGAEIITDAVVGVDDAAGQVRLEGGGTRAFDALLIAAGAHAIEGVEGATTWWPGGDSEAFGGLLRDVEEGYSKRLAIVIPPGAVWPLPAYELAIMTAGEAREQGHDDVRITVVTPERTPLSIFGPDVSTAVAEELERAGVQLITGAVATRAEGGGLTLQPSGDRLDVQRVVAIPRLIGPAIEGLAADDEGFLLTGEDGRVQGTERVWAAGDGIDSPVKFGGLATHQARVAIAGIAKLAGVEDDLDPGEAVLEGRLLLGSRQTRRLHGAGDHDGAPLWWPQGKVSGSFLPRWLAEHDFAPPASAVPAPDEGIEVRRPVRALAEEAQQLFDIRRQYRIADPDIAALGRRMRALQSRPR
ncbi:FAD-dependent oxidoreductase [Solirubrobacter phytolaccae]|uniref:FAD-dependent oxidoreductase n=1 Tax=Solirubrobacter phytolaccae TaxID=1404360 RepID=A0A9X3N6G6_9ACTN|nr:FAD-dependent oxidoreductase [Solirubrobacter phytolaccae]MDA0179169.1 FAD-dependent oxidoreductase [Solirubrobacter phytolaccae]